MEQNQNNLLSSAEKDCPKCRHSNLPEARFCSECGSTLPEKITTTKIGMFPAEQVVATLDDGNLILTTSRVRYDSVLVGSSSLISITLDSVASCGLTTRSFPLLLAIGAIALICAIILSSIESFMAFALAFIMIVAYFLSRQAVLSIASNGGQAILVTTKNMNRNSIIEFIQAVEREKLK